MNDIDFDSFTIKHKMGMKYNPSSSDNQNRLVSLETTTNRDDLALPRSSQKTPTVLNLNDAYNNSKDPKVPIS